MLPQSLPAPVLSLLSAKAVRARCQELAKWVEAGNSNWFTVDSNKLAQAADIVAGETSANYPDLKVPFHSRWRHFDLPTDAQDQNRLSLLNARLAKYSPQERGIVQYELAIVSVLLDAGAGSQWHYQDAFQKNWSRSEGLAVASIDAYFVGAFSNSKELLRADAEKLKSFSTENIEKIFQVGTSNPLLGCEGRAKLLQKLGQRISELPEIFGTEGRLGNLYRYVVEKSSGQKVAADQLLQLMLFILNPIWPPRLSLQGFPLGDVWRHSAILKADETKNLVPFHKLSQWLTYSLLEPLQMNGITITELGALTGLPEYRNGGLLIDSGVLVPRAPGMLETLHPVDSELIVEWRALTVHLLDQIAELVRKKLGKTTDELPLAAVLQGGTWTAGRKLAAQLRLNGTPPLQVVSDGTVF